MSADAKTTLLNTEQRRIVEGAMRDGRVPEHVIRAAVKWVPSSGELCRHYGPALIIAYSIRSAIEAGALAVVDSGDGS